MHEDGPDGGADVDGAVEEEGPEEGEAPDVGGVVEVVGGAAGGADGPIEGGPGRGEVIGGDVAGCAGHGAVSLVKVGWVAMGYGWDGLG